MPTSKHKAHNLVHQAIERGELSRLDGSIKCTDCDNPATVYDHRDYDMPLDVQPVCRGCNARRGSGINKGEDIWTLVKIDAALLPELRRIAAETGRSMGREVEWLARDALLWRANIKRFEEKQKENKS